VFSLPQIKSYVYQMLCCLDFLHQKGYVHRDLKCANLLLSDSNVLHIGDFGLARLVPLDDAALTLGTGAEGFPRSAALNGGTPPESEHLKPLTNNVITLWYRPPELLLGAVHYGGCVDIWSLGCIFLELFARRPLFPSPTEAHLLKKLVQAMGQPPQGSILRSLPKGSLLKALEPQAVKEGAANSPFVDYLNHTVPDPLARSLIQRMLELDPTKRITARDALQSRWFDVAPAIDRGMPSRGLPPVSASESFVRDVDLHEFTARKRRKEKDAASAAATAAAAAPATGTAGAAPMPPSAAASATAATANPSASANPSANAPMLSHPLHATAAAAPVHASEHGTASAPVQGDRPVPADPQGYTQGPGQEQQGQGARGRGGGMLPTPVGPPVPMQPQAMWQGGMRQGTHWQGSYEMHQQQQAMAYASGSGAYLHPGAYPYPHMYPYPYAPYPIQGSAPGGERSGASVASATASSMPAPAAYTAATTSSFVSASAPVSSEKTTRAPLHLARGSSGHGRNRSRSRSRSNSRGRSDDHRGRDKHNRGRDDRDRNSGRGWNQGRDGRDRDHENRDRDKDRDRSRNQGRSRY
jgi:hypothetical protein